MNLSLLFSGLKRKLTDGQIQLKDWRYEKQTKTRLEIFFKEVTTHESVEVISGLGTMYW